ncbi:suppression of tumorigenicity 5 -like [Brachionus plicatilis]|uniref:Suppression of tumorigenicity 5-like n=1 Tax=Brachionus plicatilis TaxID=10195 RepID=A0A3M7SU96_BRAPC|nr:suppression of tumorigenicity 5 -like [Brachionus plicatilis]
MQNDQFERRFNSIRSLPQGQFTKYRQMFESDSRKEQQVDKQRHANSNLEQFQMEMDKIFEGVSDETNQLLNSLCSKNQQIAEFFEQTKSNSSRDNLNEVSISSFLSDSSSTSSNESKKATMSNIYTEISSETDYADLKSASNISFNSGLFKQGNGGNITVQEPNETVITYAIESDDTDACFRSYSIDNSSLSSVPLNFSKEDQIYSSNLFKNKTDSHLPFISDDSSVDECNNSAKFDKVVQFEFPPPKPVRTFEYDIYLQAKRKEADEISKKKACDLNEHIYETLPFARSTKQENLPKNSNYDIFNTIDFFPDKSRDFNYSSQKFALSEPNLSRIGTNKKNKNEKVRRPLEKFFNNIFKKTFNRRINDKNDDEKLARGKIKEKQPVEQGVTLRNNNHTMLSKNFVTKSYIYSGQNEMSSKLKTLFDYVLIVGLNNRKCHSSDQLDSSDFINKTNPSIFWRFPDHLTDINPAIPEFCFPDPLSFSEYYKKKSEIFQFTLTNLDAKRTYGYCIRLLRKSKLPIVICILSEIDALEMYYTILTEIEKICLTSGLEQVKNFLKSLYPKPFPNRGESILVTLGFTDKNEIILNRSIDKRLEHINLYTLLSFPFDLVIKVFGSMLMEKKLIFISNKLSFLSSTIHAFETLLYPFNWPHTYIPVLPSFLIEMTEAPTPYIIGLMRSCKNELIRYKNCSDILIVDLDKQKFIHDTNSSDEMVPESLKKCLKSELTNLVNLSKNMSNYEKNFELCKIFISFFVKTIGNYQNYLVSDNQNTIESFKFLYKDFIDASNNSEIRNFLINFTQSQLFEVFISKKMQSGLNFGLMFDEAIKQENAQRNKLLTTPKTLPIKHLGKFYFKI